MLLSVLSGCAYIDESRTAPRAPSQGGSPASIRNGAPASIRNGSPASTPTKKVVRYTPPADQYVKSKLIDFDSPYDTTFLIARDVKLTDDPDQPGNRVLNAASAQIKLGALVRGRDFPGAWDLLGVRVRSAQSTPITLDLVAVSTPTTNRVANGTAVPPAGAPMRSASAQAEGAWTIQWIELKAFPTSMPANADLVLRIRSNDGTALLIDDVLLAQSHTVVSQSAVPQSGEPWQVRRSALKWQVMVGEKEIFSLAAAPFIRDGYRAIEANPVRAVFASATGMVAIDRTGRVIENGEAKLDAGVMSVAKTVAENESPAIIEVASEFGRIERNLPGDQNNDGYDETRGCYTVIASAPRLNITLTPQKFPVKWPVIEIVGLPAGTVSVWLEGQTVPWVTRLSDGKVIVELPIRLERPVAFQVRVK